MYEIEHPAFFARLLPFERLLGVPSEFEKRDTHVQVGLLGGLVPRDLAQAAVLLLAPLGGHLVEERAVHATVELIEIHGVDTIADPDSYRHIRCSNN
jgi:hypothetical protein